MDSTAFDHPVWRAAGGTLLGYGVVLLMMTLLLFLVPYAIFAL
jgi:hypothetical protein